jgi:hypothetical protein
MKLRSAGGLVMIGVIGALSLGAYLSSSGFCFSQGRYLGNAEFFEGAIADRARSIRELAEIGRPTTRADVIEYLRRHPDCCEVMGDDFFLANNFFNNLIGFKLTWIRVSHELSAAKIELSPKDGRFFEAFVGMTSCGRVFRSIGQTLKSLH